MLMQDPMILLSFINTKLRNSAMTLDALCAELGESRAVIEETLAAVGFSYDREQNQFRP